MVLYKRYINRAPMSTTCHTVLHRHSISELTMPWGPAHFCFKRLLLNRLADFDETSQQWSLGGPLQKLYKSFRSAAYLAKTRFLRTNLKRHLLLNRWREFNQTWQKWSSGCPHQSYINRSCPLHMCVKIAKNRICVFETSNDISSWTAEGNSTRLGRNDR